MAYNNNSQNKSPMLIIIIACSVGLILTISTFVVAYLLANSNQGKGLTALQAPTVTVDTTNKKISWSKVDGAVSYTVLVDNYASAGFKSYSAGFDSIKFTDANDNETNLSNYLATTTLVTIRVRAISKIGSSMDSGYSNNVWLQGDNSTNPPPSQNQLPAPSGLSYNPSTKTLSWNAVSNATGYSVNISGQTTQTANSTSLSVANLSSGSYSFTVVAICNGSTYTDSQPSSSQSFTVDNPNPITQLDPPSGFHFMSGKLLMWNNDAKASGYILNITGPTNQSPEVSAGTTQLDVTTLDLASGSYSATIIAKGDNTNYTNSNPSSPVSFVVDNAGTLQQVATPQSPSYDASNKLLKWQQPWSDNNKAVGWVVNISGQSTQQYTTTELELGISALSNGSYTFTVTAQGDGIVGTDSTPTEPFSFTVTNASNLPQLSKPSGLSYDSTAKRLNWNAVQGNNKYHIRIAPKTDPGSPGINRHDEPNNFVDFVALEGITYRSFVIAKGDGNTTQDSPISDIYEFSLDNTTPPASQLPTPTNLAYNNTTQLLSWNSVSNASGYQVDITGATTQTHNPTTNSLSVSNLANGNYSFAVTAKGNGTTYIDSAKSNPVSFTVDISVQKPQLSTPNPTASASTKLLSWTAIPNAISYSIEIDGAIESDNTTATTYSLSALTDYNKTYPIRVKANANSNTHTDSEWSPIIGYLPNPPSPPLEGDTSPEAAAARFESYINRQQWEQMFPNRVGIGQNADKEHGDFYSYDNLMQAIKNIAELKVLVEWRENANWTQQVTVWNKSNPDDKYLIAPGIEFDTNTNPIIQQEVDFGSYLLADNPNDAIRELAGSFANFAHETTGGWDTAPGGREAWGLIWRQEVGMTDENGSQNYTDTASVNFPPVSGKSYHGRGPIQLSWNMNYGLMSGILYRDKNILLQDPGRVALDGVLAFETALLFWMMPQAPKASCSDVIKNRTDLPLIQAAIQRGYTLGFGLTIIIINGGLESDEPGNNPNTSVGDRVNYYNVFNRILGGDITGEKVDTIGMPPWV